MKNVLTLAIIGMSAFSGAAQSNLGFESSSAGAITSTAQIAGWTITRGANVYPTTMCNLVACCPSAPSEASLIAAPNGLIDPIIGSTYPIYSVFGISPSSPAAGTANPQLNFAMAGTNFVRLNSAIVGDYSIEQLSRNYTVTASNYIYKYAFISVMSPAHSCCDAGAVHFKFKNLTTNSVLASSSFSTMGLSNSCNPTTGVTYYNCGTGVLSTVNTTATMFNKWKVNYVDLSAYIGNVIQIDVIVGDCTAGGHFGYTYYDAEFGTLDVQVNGQANNPVSCFATASITLPGNYNMVNWAGPNAFTSAATSFTTSTAGVYTLSIPQLPPLQNIQYSLPLVISPANVNITTTSSVICPGQPAQIMASGLSTYSWSTGALTSSITVSPNQNTTYTVTGYNAQGCEGIALQALAVSPSTLTVSANNTFVCLGQSVQITQAGAVTYTWNTGLQNATLLINPSQSTTYSVSGLNADACPVQGLVNITVSSPSLDVSVDAPLICTGQSAQLTASGLATYTWSNGSNAATISVSPLVNTTYSVIGQNADNCFADVAKTISVSLCEGISSIAADAPTILFPNPNKGEFTVQLNQHENAQLQIEDINGKIVYIKLIEQGNNHLETKLQPGLYFYAVHSNGISLLSGKLQVTQ